MEYKKPDGANMKRESIIQMFSICVALIFVIITSGCVSIGPTMKSYNGDKLQKSEVAVIKGWLLIGVFQYEGIDIYGIDGSTLEATKVEVLPGWHELVIRRYVFVFFPKLPWGEDTPPSYAPVAFNFEAGHEYKIKYWMVGILTEGVKIIDVTTGAIILTQPWH